ncbi:uncharacterized protein LOC116128252, partial [Pistacia vera]|uniref:uncharacterized protein LOC116128252 n=1 Tax=Pistacia vera TaxID=55513 RepID=UPI0012639B34
LCAGINERFFSQSSCTLCSSGRNGDDGRLLSACQVIIDAFNEAGLVLEKDATQKLKLHATVMNARHRKSKSRTRELVRLMHGDFQAIWICGMERVYYPRSSSFTEICI